MVYGIRLRDTSGNTFTMTPDAMTIVSAGSVSMPASLNVDNTYGVDIDLPASNIPVANIGVLVSPRVSAGSNAVIYTRYIDTTLYFTTFYASSASTFYTRNDATGVMTLWSAGNRTANSKSTWNPTLSIYPIAFWDKMGAATFTKIRLFAATAHLLRETHNDTNFSLAGTASGNYNVGGPASVINDNNETTWAGGSAYRAGSGETTFDGSLQVTFSSSQINNVEICHGYSADVTSGVADGTWNVQIYYSGAWHTLLSGSWTNYIYVSSITHYSIGRWNNVTAIIVNYHCRAQSDPGKEALSEYICRELRAYGSAYTDDNENKIVYTIGSNGVSTVDYLIGIKKYNY